MSAIYNPCTEYHYQHIREVTQRGTSHINHPEGYGHFTKWRQVVLLSFPENNYISNQKNVNSPE